MIPFLSNPRIFLIPVLIAFFFPVTNSMGQVINVERHRISADTVNVLTGGLGLGFNVSQNKSRIMQINTSADITYISNKHDYIILGKNNFMRVEGNNVLNDGFIHLRSVLFRDNTFAPEIFFQAQYNLDWGLKRRALAGANVRIRLSERNNFSAYISSGIMYENEIWEAAEDDLREVFNALKSTTSINVRGRIAQNLDVAAISYYQASPSSFLEPRFTSDWQLRFSISENLRFVFQFISTYDADPRLDAVDFIYNINNMVEVRF